MQLTIDDLTANAEIVEHLAWSFDLRIGADEVDPKWFSIDGIEDFQPFGRDSTGAAFVELPGSRGVLFVSSEGQAGILAADLTEFVTLIVACPYWATC